MNEEQWERYRLSVVEQTPDSPYKAAVLEGIKHKLMTLARQEKSARSVPDKQT